MQIMLAGALYLGTMLCVMTGIGVTQTVQDSLPELTKIDVKPNMGKDIPLELSFRNTRNEETLLKEYFQPGKPVIMALAYSNCPMLCSLVLDGLFEGINGLEWLPGEKYRVLTVSIDPEETATDAARRKDSYLSRFKIRPPEEGWEFLTGEEKNIKMLADALGFRYYYDEEIQQYAHPAVVFILTGDGKISRYHFGLDYPARDLKFSLMEASQGNIGSTFDKMILYCFRFDPEAKGYVLFAANLMRLSGGITLVLVIIGLALFWLKERKMKIASK